jgi:hypothetical protein
MTTLRPLRFDYRPEQAVAIEHERFDYCVFDHVDRI